jgi:hypothetical protein
MSMPAPGPRSRGTRGGEPAGRGERHVLPVDLLEPAELHRSSATASTVGREQPGARHELGDAQSAAGAQRVQHEWRVQAAQQLRRRALPEAMSKDYFINLLDISRSVRKGALESS